ncbi:hypothetical protein CSOJ01_11909 [Colletotrichum sojae]|uniref:Uncharacterized protein n=1 Tax=Colletotrichum sojae TaxID=2175907 RepID=A0A8H6IWN0_9PEZI|nr:hypothetical protein CSOJ01_11909 [Colletotrichum sojae]
MMDNKEEEERKEETANSPLTSALPLAASASASRGCPAQTLEWQRPLHARRLRKETIETWHQPSMASGLKVAERPTPQSARDAQIQPPQTGQTRFGRTTPHGQRQAIRIAQYGIRENENGRISAPAGIQTHARNRRWVLEGSPSRPQLFGSLLLNTIPSHHPAGSPSWQARMHEAGKDTHLPCSSIATSPRSPPTPDVMQEALVVRAGEGAPGVAGWNSDNPDGAELEVDNPLQVHIRGLLDRRSLFGRTGLRIEKAKIHVLNINNSSWRRTWEGSSTGTCCEDVDKGVRA